MVAAVPSLISQPGSLGEVVLAAYDNLARAGVKIRPNSFFAMKTEDENRMGAFVRLEEGLYRRGNRIFARVTVNGKLTWRSTKTNKLPQGRQWKEKWERRQWLAENGFMEAPKPASGPSEGAANNQGTTAKCDVSCPRVNFLFDQYVEAGHPILTKGGLKAKAPRSIRGELYQMNPLRPFFGEKDSTAITHGDCDQYREWRNSGGYVAKFKVRGKNVTRRTRGGDRAVDLELVVLRNAFELAVRRGQLKTNPLTGRGHYNDKSTVRHCREVAPTPAGLKRIVVWLDDHGHPHDGDLAEFLAYTGLRIGEAMQTQWHTVDWHEDLLHVRRSKKGVFPFVLLLPELRRLLRRMKRKATGECLFPSPFDPSKTRDDSCFRRRLAHACKELQLPHVTPQGLRSYFVTQARQSGLSDAEIAQLIGDKTGPILIAQVYGDVRPDHLLAVARKIRLTATTRKLRRKEQRMS
jgi:integrase